MYISDLIIGLFVILIPVILIINRKSLYFGSMVPETNDVTIREIFTYIYRLIYKINDNTVLFVAVMHGKRLLENHQQSIAKH